MESVVIFLLGMSALLNAYSTQPVLTAIASWASVPETTATWTVSTSTLGVALAAPVAGRISDRLGRKRVFVPAIWAMAAAAIACALSPTLPVLLVIRFVQGVFCPFVFAVVVAYVDEEFPLRSARLNSMYVAGTAFGGFTGRLLAGLLADATGSWRWSFLGNAVVCAVIALAAQALLPRETHFVPADRHSSSLAPGLHHLRDWRLVATFVVGFALLFQQVAVFTYGSLALQAPPFALSQTAIGLVFVVMLAPTILTPAVGVAVERRGVLPVMLLTQTLTAAALLLMVSGSAAAVIAGVALSCVGVFAGQTCATRFTARHVTQARSQAVGLYLFAYYMGGTAGAWLPQYPYEASGWPATVLLVAGVVLVSTAAATTAWRRPA